MTNETKASSPQMPDREAIQDARRKFIDWYVIPSRGNSLKLMDHAHTIRALLDAALAPQPNSQNQPETLDTGGQLSSVGDENLTQETDNVRNEGGNLHTPEPIDMDWQMAKISMNAGDYVDIPAQQGPIGEREENFAYWAQTIEYYADKAKQSWTRMKGVTHNGSYSTNHEKRGIKYHEVALREAAAFIRHQEKSALASPETGARTCKDNLQVEVIEGLADAIERKNAHWNNSEEYGVFYPEGDDGIILKAAEAYLAMQERAPVAATVPDGWKLPTDMPAIDDADIVECIFDDGTKLTDRADRIDWDEDAKGAVVKYRVVKYAAAPEGQKP